MKRKLFLLLCFVLTTVITLADGPFREHRYDGFKAATIHRNSIVFIGNSITNMHDWHSAFANHNVVNRGVSGGYATEILANLESYISGKPAKVFMMIGTNDLAPNGLNHSPEQVAANVRKVVDRIQHESPDTEIYLTSIFPSTSGGRTLEKISATNTLIKAICEEEGATFVDIYEDLKGILNNTDSRDQLHLSMSGYRIWCNAVKDYVGSDCVYPADAANQYAGLAAAYDMRLSCWGATPIKATDVLMIGDEMISSGEWHEMLNCADVKNYGQAWGYPGPWLEHTLNMLPILFDGRADNVDPKKIFLYAGVADLNDGNTTLDVAKSRYLNVLNKIHELAPSTKVYLMSLQPTSNASTNTNRIEPFNEWLETTAASDEKAEYVDIYTPFENASGVCDSKYFNGNYIYGLGYAKVAGILAPLIEGASAMTEEEAEAQINLLTTRNAFGLGISDMSDLPFGDGVGQYPLSQKAVVDAGIANAYALLNKEGVTIAELQEGGTELQEGVTGIMASINMPKASTEGNEYWYQISSLRDNSRLFTATGVTGGVQGTSDEAIYGSSMWKFVSRGDDTYDIINREYGSYLSTTAAQNTQVQTTETRPSTGWTLSYGNTQGYYIISSGEVQLNQTGSPQTYQIYNWGHSNSSYNRDDTGCQLKIQEAAEPEERPEPAETLTYTIDKNNGNLYNANGSANQSWNSTWKSTASPQLIFGCGTINNMNWSGTTVQLMTGRAGSATYTLTAPNGYVITEYSFTIVNNNHSTGLTFTMDGTTHTTSTTEKVISATEQNLNSLSFTLAGSNGNGVLFKDVTVKLMLASHVEGPEEETPLEISYIVDKENGGNYRDGTTLKTDATWCSIWKSTATPQLTFGTGKNNMNWSGNNLNLASGGSSSAFTLTPPTGYVITDYSFTFVNNGHETALTLTMSDTGIAYATSSEEQTVSASKQKLSSLVFTLAGSNVGLLLKNFTVKVKQDVIEAPTISTEGNEHWYYISNASTRTYCANKVMYYDESSQKMRFGDRTFQARYIWSFWEQDGKLAIKNYLGEYFGTAGTGTGNSTAFGVVSEPNYIYKIQSTHNAFIIKDKAVELHAQDDGATIVRWAAGDDATSASLWKFDEVDVSNAQATVVSTIVEQGKVTTGIGNKNQGIVRSTIIVSGLTGTAKLQGLTGQYTGTDASDITKVKVYLATNNRELYVDEDNKMPWREQNGVLCAETTLDDDRQFSVTFDDKELAPGRHYLWIAYDIAETAKEGNTVDAKVLNYTIDGNLREETATTGNPAHAATIFLSEGTVLISGDMGTTYYRIPSITVTKDGTRLVTLTDDRKNHNTDLPSHCYLVAQYSDDFGKTWSEPQTVAGTAETGGNYGHGDASIVTNRDNGDIIGIMTSAGTYGHGFFAGTAQEPPRWKTIVSHDNGLTWEVPVDHTDDLFGANCSNPMTQTWKSGFSGSGAALQKRDGTLVSSFVNRQADNSQHFYFFMSKDGGKSWYVSGTSGTSGADEPKTLERNNGDLAISVRAGGYNYHNVTSDDGATWKYPSQTKFTTGISGNACDGEYMVWCSTVEGNLWDIAFQTLPNSGNRQNVSIALSTDEGETFGTPKTICPRGSAYSATTVLPDGTLGVYYEENSLSTGYTMRFIRCSLDWASDGSYKFTEENPFHPIKSTVDTETGIEEMQSISTDKADNSIYDLQGRRVIAPTKAGVYIQNGKKVIITK